jgi:hypothetical protein
MNKEELIERLADKEHASWARWMQYLFSRGPTNPDGSVTIPSAFVARWQQQIDTPYAELSEQEKQSDRDEVAHILPFIEEYGGTMADHAVKEIMRTKNPVPNPEPALPPMPNPTPEQIVDPVFQAIWQTIKSWDVNVPEHYVGYCGATGSHVMLIWNALNSVKRDATPLETIDIRLHRIENALDTAMKVRLEIVAAAIKSAENAVEELKKP